MPHVNDGSVAVWVREHPINLLGAVVFWLYIVFALIFTASILQALYINKSSPRDASLQRADKLFTSLAGLSFASLSFHMLHFLVQSYQDWRLTRLQQGIDSGQSTRTFNSFLASIGEWSMTSTLFQDFGTEIARTKARFTWTLAALWVTFVVVFELGSQMAQRRVPRYWAFVGLSQILPVSFTQNLLYVSRLRSSELSQSTWDRETFENGILVVALIYAVCPFTVAGNVDRPALLWSIAFIRCLLFVPPLAALLVGGTQPHDSSSRKTRSQTKLIVTILGISCSSTQLYLALQESSLPQIGQALFGNPAVSALGSDFIISGISTLFWNTYGLCE